MVNASDAEDLARFACPAASARCRRCVGTEVRETDGIRLMCLDRAATWKDFNPTFSHHQNRVNLYSSCMLDYGLRP